MNNLTVTTVCSKHHSILAGQTVTMSSREIAVLTDKQHQHVKRDIENMLNDLCEDVSSFGRIYFDSLNRQQTEYMLDRDHAECLVTGYSAILRMKVIKRLRELEGQKSVPQTLPEALRLAADLEEQKQMLTIQLASAAPKAEFVDRYVTASGSMTFRQVAKLLNAKEPEFRLFLIENQIMYRLNGTLTPHHQHIEAGRFHVKTGTTIASNYAFSQSHFTAKGVRWIGGLWTEYLAGKELE